jgi:hypothetical protein
MKLATFLLALISFSSFWCKDKLQPALMYKVITDTVNNDVPNGKCLITGTVTHLGVVVEKANIFSANSHNTQSDKEGKFRILVDTADTYLVIHKINLPETYVEFYKFNNKHHIQIEAYIPEEDMIIIVDKPVIYLYGKENQEVHVKIEPKGEFTFTYPAIDNQNTWNGRITSGGITVANKKIPYLFYETEMSDLSFNTTSKQIEGSVVCQHDVITFLETSLSSLNLNSQEQTDFITYWAPKMIQHQKVFVQFWTEAKYDDVATLEVQPQPDNLLRVFMVFAPMKNGIIIEANAQKLDPINRNGFTVIEWGGSELPSQKLFSIKTL